MKNLHIRVVLRIVVELIVLSVSIGIIVLSVFGKSEGVIENNIIINYIANNLWYLGYPAFAIIEFLVNYTTLNNIYWLIISIFFTAFVYTILLELLYRLLEKK